PSTAMRADRGEGGLLRLPGCRALGKPGPGKRPGKRRWFQAHDLQVRDRQTRHFQTGWLDDFGTFCGLFSGSLPRVRVCERVHKSADQALRAARNRSSETRQKSTWTPSTATTGIESPYALSSAGSSVMSRSA